MSSSCGFLKLYKREGDSSFKALYPVKRFFKGSKVGHAGTLDPDATGLLIVAIGAATRLLSYAEDWDKTYSFRLHLGYATDTYDTSGQVTETALIPTITEEQILALLPQFTGLISQTPPVYSALKIDGQRAYELARKGVQVEMKSREVQIHQLDFLGFASDEKGPCLDFRARASKGTYVRSLGVDLAKALGTVGCVSKIHREAIGNHHLTDSADHLTENFAPYLQSVDQFISLPQFVAPDTVLDRMYHGNAAAWSGLPILVEGTPYFVLNQSGQAFCMAIAKNGSLQPKIRLIE